MKKKLLSSLAALCVMMMPTVGAAQSTSSTGVVNSIGMADFVKLMESVEGYVFLGLGESREIINILDRSKETWSNLYLEDVSHLTFTTTNPGIVDVNFESGKITGKSFGQTIITIADSDPQSDDIILSVFVSPTVTVYSPEGVAYNYQKTKGQPARIALTPSKDYVVNCVMRYKDGEWKDVTAEVEAGSGNNEGDGQYESTSTVNSDMIFSISFETAEHYDSAENGDVVGTSGINVQVRGKEITLVEAGTETPIAGCKVSIEDSVGNTLKNVTTNTDGTFEVEYPGVFILKVDNERGHFRIMAYE